MAGDTRQRVLDAAAQLIDERGFAAVSVGDLTAASGVSNGSIYHHFGSKDGVLARLVLDAIGGYQVEVLEAIERHEGDPRAAVHALVALHLRWMEAHPREARLISDHRDAVAAGEHGPELLAGTRVFLKAIRAWWRHQALPDVSVDVAHALVFAPAHELARLWLAGRVRTRPSTHARVLGDAAWAAILATHPDKEPA